MIQWLLDNCLKWFMLLMYVGVSAYILWRSIHCMKRIHPKFKNKLFYIVYILVFTCMDATLLLGEILDYGTARTFFHRIGNYWLGFLILLLTFTFIVDVIVLIIKLIGRKKELNFLKKPMNYAIVSILVFVTALSCTIYGCVHVGKIYVNSYETTVQKDGTNVKDLNVVLVGDLHLGYSIGLEQTQKMVDEINKMDADLIIFGGDQFDNEYDAVENPDEIAACLKTLKAKYGVYAIWGNHDVEETLVGGFPITNGMGACRDPRMTQFINSCGFHLLEDEATLVDDSFYLIGRKDTERAGDGTKNRKSIEELTEGLDASKPWIVINHEPDDFSATAAAGVDISVSGHTHAGQFFPLTIVQPFRWQNHWGYKEIEGLDTYVTSGIGVYGPPLRLGTDTEIMQITMHFEG